MKIFELKKIINLSDKLILKDIREIPEDSTEYLTNTEYEETQENEGNNNEKGILDYNIDDLLKEYIINN